MSFHSLSLFFFGILSSVGDLARTCDFAHFPPINMAIRIFHGWKFLLDPRKMLPPLRKCTGNKLSSGYNFWPQLRFIVLFKPNRSTKSQSKTFSKKRNFRRHTILNFDFDWQLIKKWRQEIRRNFYKDFPERSGGTTIVCNKCRVTKNYFWKT